MNAQLGDLGLGATTGLPIVSMGSPTAQYWPRVVVLGPRVLAVAGEAADEQVESHCVSAGRLVDDITMAAVLGDRGRHPRR